MELKDFIEEFVEPNTLIRLWYKTKEGHETVFSTERVQMEHRIVKSGEYRHHEVVGVTDIVVRNTHYPEAVNITIKRNG